MPTLSQEWLYISIHALREEGDKLCKHWMHTTPNFYPRPP